MKKKRLVLFFLFLPMILLSQINVNQYIKQYNKEKDPAEKYTLLKQIREMKNPLFNTLFLDIISHDNPFNLKREAIQGLEDNSDGPNMIVADKAAKLLENEQNPMVIEAILHLLGKIGMEKHTSVIVPFLKNEDEYVREAAVQSLYNIGDKSCLAPVKDLLQSEKGETPTSRNIRKYGMMILSKFQDSSSLSELEQIFKDSSSKETDNDESLYALNAIKEADPEKAKEIVIENTNAIQSAAVKETLIEKAEVDMNTSVSDSAELQTETEESPPSEEKSDSLPDLSLTQADVQQMPAVYTTPEEAEKQITLLSNTALKLKEKIQNQSASDEDYSFLGDIYLKLGNIRKNLKDQKTAIENYHKAEQAYKKIIE